AKASSRKFSTDRTRNRSVGFAEVDCARANGGGRGARPHPSHDDACAPALVTPRNHMLLYSLCRWFHHRWRTQCVGKSITNSSLSKRKRRTLGSSKSNVRA